MPAKVEDSKTLSTKEIFELISGYSVVPTPRVGYEFFTVNGKTGLESYEIRVPNLVENKFRRLRAKANAFIHKAQPRLLTAEGEKRREVQSYSYPRHINKISTKSECNLVNDTPRTRILSDTICHVEENDDLSWPAIQQAKSGKAIHVKHTNELDKKSLLLSKKSNLEGKPRINSGFRRGTKILIRKYQDRLKRS